MDVQLWETKDKAIDQENWGALEKASFILNLEFYLVPARNAPASK